MNIKKIYIMLIVFSFTISSLSFIHALPQDDSVNTSSTTSLLSLRLFNATYNDFDDDGKKDDVECFLTIKLSDEKTRKNFICDIHIYLPNGDNYSYSILVSMVYDTVTLRLLFMNHAYTPGDYTIKAEINLFTNGYYYDETDIVFDPPSEEVPDDDPYLQVA